MSKIMNIKLKKASIDDANLIWDIQVRAFSELFEKYKDIETNPANETIDKTVKRLKEQETYYYLILMEDVTVGAIRVVDYHNDEYKRISPIFILKKYRNKGIAQRVIKIIENIHGIHKWQLATILQEKRNCYLYEKMGYKKTEQIKIINNEMTLIYYEKE